jgi:hypothetical protein
MIIIMVVVMAMVMIVVMLVIVSAHETRISPPAFACREREWMAAMPERDMIPGA